MLSRALWCVCWLLCCVFADVDCLSWLLECSWCTELFFFVCLFDARTPPFSCFLNFKHSMWCRYRIILSPCPYTPDYLDHRYVITNPRGKCNAPLWLCPLVTTLPKCISGVRDSLRARMNHWLKHCHNNVILQHHSGYVLKKRIVLQILFLIHCPSSFVADEPH